ncbi:MAG: tRNA uridine-5-carboxymethylaminomethyl(34) synthesis GTPase MnmE [Acidobacteria bacterium]|nr:tRNA uridine-5-carboxymethylaminomethyl(34) synthesis GTPase MnmE [Acidobacteriota bacterium]
MFSSDDTIVAIATPDGRGGIGVVRISGTDALRVAAAILDRREPLVPRHATFARVIDRGGGEEPIDQVVATFFQAPASYTGEDVVEISGHGSPVLMRDILMAAVKAGARLAGPGEFTLRAHLSGRMDLVQAEAIADLIEAATPLQARVAFDQLEGTLTRRIGELHEALFDLTARLEASLDFPDEGYHFLQPNAAATEIRVITTLVDALLSAGRIGRLIREGRHAVLVGRTNTGKSSVFNMLAGAQRAIVTATPGTTRDLLTERVDLGGIPLTLVDTAGLRSSEDEVEIEGMSRARRADAMADLRIVVLDRSRPLDQDDLTLLAETGPAGVVVAINKCDLPACWNGQELPTAAPTVQLSALRGEGFAELRATIETALGATEPTRDTAAISNVRHVALLARAREALDRAAGAASAGASEEFVLADLAEGRTALEEITGARTPDDVLAHIFSRFCIGK